MAEALAYCDQCKGRISPGDVAEGLAIASHSANICAECTGKLAPDIVALLKMGAEHAARPGGSPDGRETAPSRKKPGVRRIRRDAKANSSSTAKGVLAIVTVVAVASIGVLISLTSTSPPNPETPSPEPPRGVARTSSPTMLPSGSAAPGLEEQSTADASLGDAPVLAVAAPREESDEPEGALAIAAPAAEKEWISLLNGPDMDGWHCRGGTLEFEKGTITIGGDIDLFYGGDFEAFTLECEMFVKEVHGLSSGGISVAHSKPGRGNHRVLVMLHNDGDAHVRAEGRVIWRSGAGAFPIGGWNRIRVHLTRSAISIHNNDRLLRTLDLSEVPPKAGGVFFFSSNDAISKIRNIRLRPD